MFAIEINRIFQPNDLIQCNLDLVTPFTFTALILIFIRDHDVLLF